MSLRVARRAPPRPLRTPPHQEFPLVRRQHPDHGDGRADPGGRRRLADVCRHARPAGAGHGRAGRGGAVHRVRALRRPRRRRARPPAHRAARRWSLLFACALGAGGGQRAALRPRPRAPGRARFSGVIYAIIVVCGAARSFLLPARNALGADLVPRPLFPSAVAWRTGIWQVAAVAGPALGGMLYAWVGPTRSYVDRRGR